MPLAAHVLLFRCGAVNDAHPAPRAFNSWFRPMSAFPPDSFVVADVVPSPNHDERKQGRAPDMILLHYTGMATGEAALHRLCSPDSKVSAHYVVFEDGRIVQCVPEERRAWHAGVSSWAGETDINSCSIGIEIVNPGHEFGYRDFPLRQIAAVISLCKSIITRRGPIAPDRVLGAFRRGAGAQAGSGREISLGPVERIRRRPLGAPGPAHYRRRLARPGEQRRTGDAAAARACAATATASRRPAAMTRPRARWSRHSSAISARPGWTASPTPPRC